MNMHGTYKFVDVKLEYMKVNSGNYIFPGRFHY